MHHTLHKVADVQRGHAQPPKLNISAPTPSNAQHQEMVSSPISPTKSTGSGQSDHSDGVLTSDDRE